MKILLLEPYCGGSHRAWAQGYAVRSSHDVTLATLRDGRKMMRIEVRLPRIEPDVYDGPGERPKRGGRHFKPHGVKGEQKAIRDLVYREVRSFRQKCLRCGYKMRVYPRGVSNARQGDGLKTITVLLYVWG